MDCASRGLHGVLDQFADSNRRWKETFFWWNCWPSVATPSRVLRRTNQWNHQSWLLLPKVVSIHPLTGKAVGATRSTSFWQTVWKNIRISTASVVSKPMIVLIAWNRFFFVAKHQSKTVKKRYTDSTVSTLKLNEGMDFHAHWERGWRTTSSGSLLSTD